MGDHAPRSWRNSCRFRLSLTPSLPVPAIEVLLAHLIIHGILDHELNNGPLFVTDIVHLLRNNRIDGERWQRLVERLGLHQAVALTASLLPQPEQARSHLQASLHLQGLRVRHMQREIAHLAAALEPLGVPWVLLKGAAYVALELPFAAQRQFGDIDLLPCSPAH